MSDEIEAWHFVGKTLRDGRPIPADGRWLIHRGPIVPCESGLHASVRLIDALRHAPGATVCRVVVRGEIIHEADKLVASRRKIMWRIDATDLLYAFARQCALDVAHLWNMPDVVRQYLETGNGALREKARVVAAAAAKAAARAAAAGTTWAAAAAGTTWASAAAGTTWAWAAAAMMF